MANITMEFSIGRDDEQVLKLTKANVPLPLKGETGGLPIDRITFVLKRAGQADITVDSSAPADVGMIDWTSAGLDRGEVKLKIGGKLPALPGDWAGKLYLYDTGHPAGLWHRPEIKVSAVS